MQTGKKRYLDKVVSTKEIKIDEGNLLETGRALDKVEKKGEASLENFYYAKKSNFVT